MQPFKKSRSGGNLGTAATKLAIESFRNIANADIGMAKSASSTPGDDDAITKVISLLQEAGSAMAVADIAKRLNMDSSRAANILVRAGKAGLLKFSTIGEAMTVELV